MHEPLPATAGPAQLAADAGDGGGMRQCDSATVSWQSNLAAFDELDQVLPD